MHNSWERWDARDGRGCAKRKRCSNATSPPPLCTPLIGVMGKENCSSSEYLLSLLLSYDVSWNTLFFCLDPVSQGEMLLHQ